MGEICTIVLLWMVLAPRLFQDIQWTWLGLHRSIAYAPAHDSLCYVRASLRLELSAWVTNFTMVLVRLFRFSTGQCSVK